MPVVNGAWTPPTTAQFQSYFFRDFPYAPATDPNDTDYVTPTDIANASTEAQVNFSAGVFGANADILFYYLWAHFLVINLQNAQKGLSAQAQFALESSSVGSVSLTNQIVDRFKDDPIFSSLLTTGYGKKFLDLAYPYTIGGVNLNFGNTTSA
jgi:Protein of unknown function (DUF4054)